MYKQEQTSRVKSLKGRKNLREKVYALRYCPMFLHVLYFVRSRQHRITSHILCYNTLTPRSIQGQDLSSTSILTASYSAPYFTYFFASTNVANTSLTQGFWGGNDFRVLRGPGQQHGEVMILSPKRSAR